MKAVITTDATGEKEISGTVTRVVRVKNQSLTDSTTTGNYSAEITISDNSLLIGMTAKATIILAEKADVLAVPYDLIRYDESGNAYILTAEGNGDGTATAVRKNITLGEEVDYYTEVTGGDLKEGDMLIYDYDGTVSEGDVFSPEQLYSEQSIDSLTVTDVPNTEEEAAP
jgi:multidrug efflux pump subunit AcrA (membrane-fusion protein)